MSDSTILSVLRIVYAVAEYFIGKLSSANEERAKALREAVQKAREGIAAEADELRR